MNILEMRNSEKLTELLGLLEHYEKILHAYAADPDGATGLAITGCVAELSGLFTPDVTELAYEFGEFVIASSRLQSAILSHRLAHARGQPAEPLPDKLLRNAQSATLHLRRAVTRLRLPY